MASEVRDKLRYAKSHEWVRLDGDVATIGITDYAQHELTDVVFVDLPKVGTKFQPEAEFGVVESVKSVSELYTPVGGEVVEVNSRLEDAPELVNESPYDDGWLIKIKVSDKAPVTKLLDAKAYQKMTDG